MGLTQGVGGSRHRLGPILRMMLRTFVVWVPTTVLIYLFMEPFWQVDMRAGVRTDKFSITAYVNNLFDKQPPVVADLANQWPGTNTVASSYDLIGRRFYAGVRARF